MMHLKYKTLYLFFLLIILNFSSCSSDDDNSNGSENFYANALKSANTSNLVGIWAIFELSYQGETFPVPNNNGDCGREFFIYQETGIYSQYTISEYSGCVTEESNANWKLDQGIVTLSSGFNQFEEVVVVQLTQDLFVFKVKFDVDDDGVLDIITATAKPYTIPNTIENYEYMFSLNRNEEHRDKIRFDWVPYNGFYEFEKYEIYRSLNCDKSNSELYTTIDDKNQTFFIEETPPKTKEPFCYFLKIYTNKGFLGESQLAYVYTDYLLVNHIKMNSPEVSNNTIILNWNPYEGRYFSHYEIKVQNYISGSGYGYQEKLVATINEKEKTNYTDINPPYLVNPIYTIHAYDIFGNKSSYDYDNENIKEVNFKRPEVLEQNYIQKIAIDTDAPILYFYSKPDYPDRLKIYRYNYSTYEMEATSKEPINVSNSLDMKVFNSNLGKEIFFSVGNELYVFDATNLELKYKLKVENQYVHFDDFCYIKDDLWILIDGDKVYSATRNNANFIVLDEQIHFTDHQGSRNYQILDIKNNAVLVGHDNEPQSLKFSFNNEGIFTEKVTVNIEFSSGLNKRLIYNENANTILNLNDKLIYKASDFSFVKSFTTPNTPTAYNTLGNTILGSNNDEEWSISEDSNHEKKAFIYNITTGAVESFDTGGYPLFLFENYLGEIISISSGFKRKELIGDSQKPDVFIEKVK